MFATLDQKSSRKMSSTRGMDVMWVNSIFYRVLTGFGSILSRARVDFLFVEILVESNL